MESIVSSAGCTYFLCINWYIILLEGIYVYVLVWNQAQCKGIDYVPISIYSRECVRFEKNRAGYRVSGMDD